MRGSPIHRPARTATVLAMLTVLLICLTGCMRYTIDGKINSDGTISGSFIFALSKATVGELFGSEGSYLAELRRQLTQPVSAGGSKFLVPPQLKHGTVNIAVYRSGDLLGYRQHFDRVPLRELDRSTFKASHTNGRFIIDIHSNFIDLQKFQDSLRDTSAAARSSSPPPSAAPRPTTNPSTQLSDELRSQGVDPETVIGSRKPDLKIRLEFPGQIISANGNVHDRSVSWELSLNSRSVLHVSAWDAPRHRFWLWEAFFGVCAIGAAYVLYQLLRLWVRRRSGAAVLQPEPEPRSLGFAGLPILGDNVSAHEPGSTGKPNSTSAACPNSSN
ncbi:MAG: hypothetical protein DLM55_03145 [Acidimicrobiales bacterium]|nr:MAG: hypothetical protein DLM55_03145 [Acidimicrobiales bacterium]